MKIRLVKYLIPKLIFKKGQLKNMISLTYSLSSHTTIIYTLKATTCKFFDHSSTKRYVSWDAWRMKE